jgi:protein-S-isoprenylcysteine O-methyltransferase Ste14
MAPLLLAVDLLIGRWDLVFVNIVLFAAFLLFIPFRRKVGWRAHSVYTGFLIALFAEMFGFPLTIYFISSFFGRITFQNQFLEYMSSLGMPVGLVITFIGLLFVIAGWRLIYKKKPHQQQSIVTDGIYAYVRHPQYLGFILITLGWLIHWPTIPIVIMWPILVAIYYKLAKKEEKEMEKIFGERYVLYKKKVPMLIPGIK